VKAEGVRIGTEMCKALLDGGAPGLHFYTLNLENVRTAAVSPCRAMVFDWLILR
jgi:5,10-methylenetetrahydrofolate reductase